MGHFYFVRHSVVSLSPLENICTFMSGWTLSMFVAQLQFLSLNLAPIVIEIFMEQLLSKVQCGELVEMACIRICKHC